MKSARNCPRRRSLERFRASYNRGIRSYAAGHGRLHAHLLACDQPPAAHRSENLLNLLLLRRVPKVHTLFAEKTRRRVDIEQPLGLDNIKIIVDNSLEWRIFHDPRRNDRSFSPPPRQRGRRAIKPSFAASHISQGRRFGAGRSPQTAWRLLRDRGCAPARDGRSARRICPNRGARA